MFKSIKAKLRAIPFLVGLCGLLLLWRQQDFKFHPKSSPPSSPLDLEHAGQEFYMHQLPEVGHHNLVHASVAFYPLLRCIWLGYLVY